MPVYVNGELVLYGFVGDSYWREGFTSLEVLQALVEHGCENDITVRINSGGGHAFEGMAIYNALTAHKGTVTVVNDAIAASAASIIAMAGDKIIMRAGSEMMIHDPSGVTFGTSQDHQKTAGALDKLASQMGVLYAARSEKDAAEVRQIMKDETWLTPEEAVEAGFADEAEDAKAKPASAFDYRIYSKAPERLVALAEKNGWSFDQEINRIAASAAPTSQKETEMADKNGADGNSAATEKATADAVAAAVTAANERIQAILGSEDAKGREEQARHFAFNTNLSADAAVEALKVAPVAASADASDDADTPDPAAYEAERMRAAGQALPGGSAAPDKPNWTAAIKRAGKQRNQGA